MFYEFISGPLALISILIFLGGVIYHVWNYFTNLDGMKDRVAYKQHLGPGIKGAIRSLFFWLLPYGTHSWRAKPGVTFLIFLLHIGILFTPVFLSAHNVLLQSELGFSFWSMPDALADFLTIAVIISALMLLVRRIVLPEVRIITNLRDLIMIAITIAPFATGYLSYHQVSEGNIWLILHILSGELMLIAIPFTKLSHFVLFFCSRIQLGMDYGIKRGGRKNNGLDW